MDSSTPSIKNGLARLTAALAIAVALPAAATDATEVRAREQFRAGQAAYAKDDYEKALTAFSAAYGLQPVPGLLFDIAQCHRQLGDYERAAVFYQQYLELSPSTANAAAVRALLTDIRASEKQRKRGLADEEQVRRAMLKTPSQVAGLDAALGAREPSPELARAAAKDSIFQKWWFWTGAGAIALGTTAFILANHAANASPDAMSVSMRAR